MLRRGDGELKDSRAATRAAGREHARHEGWGVGELAGARRTTRGLPSLILSSVGATELGKLWIHFGYIF
jgi:hypothetical protein